MIRDTQRVCSVGVDLGTTAIKIVAFASGVPANDEQIALASRPSHLHRRPDGAAELDPREQLDALHEALVDCLGQVRRLGYSVARIGLSAAMHSVLAVSEDGSPLTPVLTWADLRAEADAQALWASPQGPELYARTGVPIHAMSVLAKLLWLRRAHPDIFQQAARFVGLKEWIWHQWFQEWKVDASLASATGLYNLRERQWDAQALALTSLDAARLSTIVPTHYRGATAPSAALRATGIPEETSIVIGASDGVLANLGAHVSDGRRLVVTIGTSLAVRVGANAITTDPETRSFCYVLSEEQGLYVLGAPSNSGGSVLEWVYQRGADAFARGATGAPPTRAELPFDEALAAAGSTTAADDLYFLPYIAGERAPLWTTRTSGALIGLRSEHTALDALRAAVEGILLNAYWISEPFLTRPTPPEAIIASGGVFQSAWIRQLAADIFGLPVYEVASLEASASGAALLAEIADGACAWADVEKPLAPTSIATPDPARHTRYHEKFVTFRRLAKAVSVL